MNKLAAVATIAIVAGGGSLVAQEKVLTRGIIRSGIDKDGKVHGDLAKLTGMANATSLSYKILLLGKEGKEQFVDEASYTFKVGQQFRLEIECDSDLYLYVFHEGPDRTRTVLIPDATDGGRIPMAKKGEKKIVPDDGTYFEFVEPVGTERVLVYATAKKRSDLTPEEAFKDPKSLSPNKQLEMKSTQDGTFAKAKEYRTRAAFSYRTKKNEANPAEGKIEIVGTKDKSERPELFVEIPLTTK